MANEKTPLLAKPQKGEEAVVKITKEIMAEYDAKR